MVIYPSSGYKSTDTLSCIEPTLSTKNLTDISPKVPSDGLLVTTNSALLSEMLERNFNAN